MSESENAILTLQVILTIAPIAAYFLTLGVVNSQSRPRLISGRYDFLLLTGTFLPIVFWPLASVSNTYGWHLVLAIALLAGLGLRTVLPHPWKHWVIYNADAAMAGVAVRSALDRLGWQYRQDSPRIFRLTDRQMRIEITGLGLLNAVNLHVHTDAANPAEAQLDPLIGALGASLRRYELLPTATGLCLVLIGAGLMIVPMWMMTRHMRDIVEAIERLFVA